MHLIISSLISYFGYILLSGTSAKGESCITYKNYTSLCKSSYPADVGPTCSVEGTYCENFSKGYYCVQGHGYLPCNYTLIGYCPSGYFCPNVHTKVICPKKKYCPVGGINPIPCLFGEYSCNAEAKSKPTSYIDTIFFFFCIIFPFILTYEYIVLFVLVLRDRYLAKLLGIAEYKSKTNDDMKNDPGTINQGKPAVESAPKPIRQPSFFPAEIFTEAVQSGRPISVRMIAGRSLKVANNAVGIDIIQDNLIMERPSSCDVAHETGLFNI